jgi:hypothetical protein
MSCMKWLSSTKRKEEIIHWLIFALCLFPLILQSQYQITVVGVIKDQSTQLPIEGVNITIKGTNTGAITNSQGVFDLKISKLPAVLQISHITYYSKQKIVTESQANSLVIYLTPRMINLDEAEIISEKYKVFKGKQQEVIDYECMDSSLIILSYNVNKNHHELILTDEHFDTLNIKDISHLKKPKQLFKDCTGSCHLLTKDSAYQVYVNNGSIQLIYSANMEKFSGLLGNCLFETPSHLAFEDGQISNLNNQYASRDLSALPNIESGNEKWNHVFFLVDKTTKEKVLLDKVFEWEKKRAAIEHASFGLPDSHRTYGEMLRFAEMVFFKPSFQTVKLINDTIYYFNHLKSQIDIYSQDLILVKTINVEYHNQDNWKPVIISDIVKNKAYTIFTRGAKYLLMEIDLNDGSVSEMTKIDKLFPEKIIVHNGYLYFLYNNLNNIWQKRSLFQGQLIE